MATTSEKQKEDFKNSIFLLKTYINLYEVGNSLIYLPMAVELRKLLCKNKEGALIKHIIPNIELYKLHSTEFFANNPNLLVSLDNFMPGRLSFSDDKLPKFNLLFSTKKEKIKLESWIDQMFFKEGITICELIKSVADKQAAHADRNYNDTLLHCKIWTFNDVGCHILGVYALSKFIYDFVSIEYKDI